MIATFGSLFAGIGGIDLGLERAGWECKWQVEVDPFCQAVLKKHWPQVPKFGDVRELTGKELSPVDLIAGGFPCQPVSVAGQKKAQADERWLWPEFERLIGILRPRFVLVENVPGLLNANDGSAMGEVLGDLAALRYDAEWESLPAAAFGAPHLRYRVFILAYAKEQRLEGTEPARTIFAKRRFTERTQCDWWTVEPDVGRVAYGVPDWMDRLKALGNAVVPQVAEWIGRRILAYLLEAD